MNTRVESCCDEHRSADLDHKPVFQGPDPDDCSRCGLAVTGLGERHGYDDVSDCPNRLPDYEALGQTEEEIVLLREHDKDEVLHAFRAADDTAWSCLECGDTAEGLMHNNTWRNVEPLMEDS